ncbi:MAG: TetR/AcrR family transcriptional regulator [Ilumatobacteraceae bacterium]
MPIRDRSVGGRTHAPSAQRRRPELVPNETHDRHLEIVDAALELFATIGYRATTMAQIGDLIGIRGPSLYKHIASKHELLVEIMTGMMDELLRRQRRALDAGGDVSERLRRITVVHVQYHAEHRYEAFVGHREIDNLEEPQRTRILDLRREYESRFRELVQEGCRLGVLRTSSDRWSSYAVLDMGIGVSAWFNPAGSVTPDELAETYAEFALRMLGADLGPGGSGNVAP